MEKTTRYQLPYITSDDLVKDAPSAAKDMAEKMEEVLGKIYDRLGELTIGTLYPIGAIYCSVDSTDPGMMFGGTWERFAQGKTLIGVDEDDADFSFAGAEGGEKTHTMTLDELVPHTHTVAASAYNFVNVSPSDTYGFSHSTQTSSTTGGGKPFNELPPYVTVYMWKRIA